jgi:hypothetical protein
VKLSRTSLSFCSDVLRVLMALVDDLTDDLAFDFADDFGATSICFAGAGFTGTIGLTFFVAGFLMSEEAFFAAGNGAVFSLGMGLAIGLMAVFATGFATVFVTGFVDALTDALTVAFGVDFGTGFAGSFAAALRAGATAFFGAALRGGATAFLAAGFFGVAASSGTVVAAATGATTAVANAFEAFGGVEVGRALEVAMSAVASGEGDAVAMEFVIDFS